jgi:tRNA 2-thiouridine synthesizing protein A
MLTSAGTVRYVADRGAARTSRETGEPFTILLAGNEERIMSDVNAIHVDRELDAKGMLCPMPVISVKRAIKDLERGQVVAIRATDKGACRDIPAWAEQTGHKLLASTEEQGVYTFYIEKAGWDDDE